MNKRVAQQGYSVRQAEDNSVLLRVVSVRRSAPPNRVVRDAGRVPARPVKLAVTHQRHGDDELAARFDLGFLHKSSHVDCTRIGVSGLVSTFVGGSHLEAQAAARSPIVTTFRDAEGFLARVFHDELREYVSPRKYSGWSNSKVTWRP